MIALGENLIKVFAGSSRAESMAVGETIVWSRLAVENLTVTADTNTQVSLNWNDISPNEVQFEIHRSLASDFSSSTILTASANSESFNDSGLTHNTTYFYKVCGVFDNGMKSDFSEVKEVKTKNEVAIPSALTATAQSNTEISLSWSDNSNNEEGFKIYRSADNVDFELIDTTTANVVQFTDTGLSHNTVYYYKLEGFNVDHTSNQISASATTLNEVADPSGLTATAQSNTQISLSWSDNSNNEDGFKIYRSTDNSNFTLIETTAGNVVQHTDQGLIADTTYYYKVEGFNVDDTSNTVLASATTLDALVAPTSLTASAQSNTSISLSWNDTNANEDNYIVKRSTSTGFTTFETFQLAAGSNSYIDNGLTADTTYYYRVYASNSNGISASDAASAKTLDTLVPPTSFTATALSNTSISLSWNDTNTNEDDYVVEGATSLAGPFLPIATVPLGTSFTLNGLTANTTYYYRVYASNTSGISTFISASATTLDALVAPTSLTASAQSNTSISLSWNDTNANEDNYIVKRSTSTGFTTFETFQLAAGSTSYLDTGLSANTTYYYRVYASNTSGNGSYSSVNKKTLDALVAPTGLTVVSSSNSTISLSWNDTNANEDNYIVKRSTSTGFTTFETFQLAAGSTSYLDTGLSANTTYYYRVYASNTSGNSGYATANGFTDDTIQYAPTIIPEADSDDNELKIVVSQDQNTNSHSLSVEYQDAAGILESGSLTLTNAALSFTSSGGIDPNAGLSSGPFPYRTSINLGAGGSNYRARARVISSSGDAGPWSDWANFTTNLFIPSNISITSVNNSGATINFTNTNTLAFNSIDLAIKHRVLYKIYTDTSYTESPDVNLTGGTPSSGGSAAYNLTGLNPDTIYDIKIEVYNQFASRKTGIIPGNAATGHSIKTTNVLNKPTGLSFTSSTNNSITISWNDNNNNETGHRIFVAPNSSETLTTALSRNSATGGQSFSVAANVTTFTASNLSASLDGYDFIVSAYNNTTENYASSKITAFLDADSDGVPDDQDAAPNDPSVGETPKPEPTYSSITDTSSLPAGALDLNGNPGAVGDVLVAWNSVGADDYILLRKQGSSSSLYEDWSNGTAGFVVTQNFDRDEPINTEVFYVDTAATGLAAGTSYTYVLVARKYDATNTLQDVSHSDAAYFTTDLASTSLTLVKNDPSDDVVTYGAHTLEAAEVDGITVRSSENAVVNFHGSSLDTWEGANFWTNPSDLHTFFEAGQSLANQESLDLGELAVQSDGETLVAPKVIYFECVLVSRKDYCELPTIIGSSTATIERVDSIPSTDIQYHNFFKLTITKREDVSIQLNIKRAFHKLLGSMLSFGTFEYTNLVRTMLLPKMSEVSRGLFNSLSYQKTRFSLNARIKDGQDVIVGVNDSDYTMVLSDNGLNGGVVYAVMDDKLYTPIKMSDLASEPIADIKEGATIEEQTAWIDNDYNTSSVAYNTPNNRNWIALTPSSRYFLASGQLQPDTATNNRTNLISAELDQSITSNTHDIDWNHNYLNNTQTLEMLFSDANFGNDHMCAGSDFAWYFRCYENTIYATIINMKTESSNNQHANWVVFKDQINLAGLLWSSYSAANLNNAPDFYDVTVDCDSTGRRAVLSVKGQGAILLDTTEMTITSSGTSLFDPSGSNTNYASFPRVTVIKENDCISSCVSGDGKTVALSLDPDVTSVAAHSSHSLYVKSDGSLWAMGRNNYGQLGNGNTDDQSTPVEIERSGVTSVTAGYSHSLYLKSDGSLWAMGNNNNGRLGDGTTDNRSTPVQIESGGVTSVSAGGYHSLYLKSDGSLWAMGSNNYGQLGDGTTDNRITPVQIETGGVTSVSAGGYHSLYLKSDGSLWAMGNNNYGQFGDGTEQFSGFDPDNVSITPVQIQSGGVTSMAAGGEHSLFVKSDGSLWAMGSNFNGQLGDGTNRSKILPVQIESSDVASVTAGGSHSLYVKSDGSLWGMGASGFGQLGDGSEFDDGNPFIHKITTPVEIESSGVTNMAAGSEYSLFVKSDGSLWGMGDNRYGSLGDEIEALDGTDSVPLRNTPGESIQAIAQVLIYNYANNALSLKQSLSNPLDLSSDYSGTHFYNDVQSHPASTKQAFADRIDLDYLGENMVVGCPHVFTNNEGCIVIYSVDYTYYTPGGSLELQSIHSGSVNQRQGNAVKISGDGHHIFTNRYRYNSSFLVGNADHFVRDGDTWTLVKTFGADSNNNWYGGQPNQLALSENGSRASALWPRAARFVSQAEDEKGDLWTDAGNNFLFGKAEIYNLGLPEVALCRKTGVVSHLKYIPHWIIPPKCIYFVYEPSKFHNYPFPSTFFHDNQGRDGLEDYRQDSDTIHPNVQF